MITAIADKVIFEDVNHRIFVVYAKDGPINHRRKVYKNYKAALDYANSLLHYYQVSVLTEIARNTI